MVNVSLWLWARIAARQTKTYGWRSESHLKCLYIFMVILRGLPQSDILLAIFTQFAIFSCLAMPAVLSNQQADWVWMLPLTTTYIVWYPDCFTGKEGRIKVLQDGVNEKMKTQLPCSLGTYSSPWQPSSAEVLVVEKHQDNASTRRYFTFQLTSSWSTWICSCWSNLSYSQILYHMSITRLIISI